MTGDDDQNPHVAAAEVIKRELAVIAELRALMKQSEGSDFRPPTNVPDRLLDQLNDITERRILFSLCDICGESSIRPAVRFLVSREHLGLPLGFLCEPAVRTCDLGEDTLFHDQPDAVGQCLSPCCADRIAVCVVVGSCVPQEVHA